MKKGVFAIIFILSLWGCNSKKNNEVNLFNGITFTLIENEQLINIGAQEKEVFRALFNDSSIQVPLFKCIKSNDYSIYIGLPVSTSISKLFESKPQYQKEKIDTDSLTYCYVNYKEDNNNNISEYFVKIDENIFYILAFSNSLELSDSLFNFDSLAKRLKM